MEESSRPSLKDGGTEVHRHWAKIQHPNNPRKTKYKTPSYSALRYSAPLAGQKIEAFPNSILTSPEDNNMAIAVVKRKL